jgi:Mg2+ and Co2+ transporter CorA
MSLILCQLWNQIARRHSRINTDIAQVNHTIALESKRDNAQMKSIALLTMIYIPLSCVASVFSTSLFNFDPKEGEIVSKYFWVFLGVSAALTLVTVGIWHFTTNRQVKKDDFGHEMGLGK